VPAVLAPEARKPRRQTPAREKRPELPLHEARQALAVAQRGRVRAEGFEVVPDQAVEHGVGGIARLIGDGVRKHVRRARAGRATG